MKYVFELANKTGDRLFISLDSTKSELSEAFKFLESYGKYRKGIFNNKWLSPRWYTGPSSGFIKKGESFVFEILVDQELVSSQDEVVKIVLLINKKQFESFKINVFSAGNKFQ